MTIRELIEKLEFYEKVGGVEMNIQLNTIQKYGKLNNITRLEEGVNEYGHHEYLIEGLSGCANRENEMVVMEKISFQSGPRYEPGSKHGVTDQDLLEIVRDRLTAFMQGELPSKETEKALEHVEIALMYLNKRVEDRIERNTLGTYKK